MRTTFGSAAAAASLVALAHSEAYAGPEGAQVVSGQVNIAQQGALTQITASNNAIINYSQFNIAQHETVQFIQPSATARVLNRVTSGDMTQIHGNLQANGIVYLVNPAGIFFGNSAVVDAAGFRAAAGNMADADFLRNIDRFSLTGDVTNLGTIQGQAISLLGKHVKNVGSVVAPDGMVTMVAGDEVLIGERNGIMVKLGGDAASTESGVENSGSIDTGSKGSVALGAGDVYSLAVKNTGSIRGSQIVVSGEGSQVIVSGDIDATNDAGTGGSVEITGQNVKIVNANIDASGSTGGGSIKVGGDYQGTGSLATADTTYVSSGSTLKANATTSGDGGTVIVWSDQVTGYVGKIEATGAGNGSGGLVEVSGKQNLIFAGTVDLSGAGTGSDGSLLLDPTNITIGGVADIDGSGGGGDDIAAGTDLDDAALDFPGATSLITDTALEALLVGNATITLAATNQIQVLNAITGAGNASLTLTAATISINAGIELTGTGVLTLNGGAVTITDAIVLASGNFVSSGSTFQSTNAITTTAGNIDLTGHTGNVQVNDVTATAGSVSITTTNGASDPTIQVLGTLTAGSGATLSADGQVSFLDGTTTFSITGGLTVDAGSFQTVTGSGTASGVIDIETTVGNLQILGNVESTGATVLLDAATDFLNDNAITASTGVTITAGNGATVNNDITNTTGTASVSANDGLTVSAGILTSPTLSLQSGADGSGDLTVSTGTTFAAGTLTFRAGNGAGTGKVTFTEPLTITDVAGTGSPTSFTVRQDDAITDSDLIEAASFTNGVGSVGYTLRSDVAGITISTAARVNNFGSLTLNAATGISITNNISGIGSTNFTSGTTTSVAGVSTTNAQTYSAGTGMTATGNLASTNLGITATVGTAGSSTSSFQNLSVGGAQTVAINTSAGNTHNITFNGSAAAGAGNIVVTGNTGTDNVTVTSASNAAGFSFNGAGGVADSFTGPNTGTTYTINNANAATLSVGFTGTLTNVGFLNGGTGDDTFVFTNTGLLSGQLSGGAGNDTMIGDDDGNNISITGLNSGFFNPNIDTDSNDPNPDFTSIENITGGAGNDFFSFDSGGGAISGNLSGGTGGTDQLQANTLNAEFIITGAGSGTFTTIIGGTFAGIDNLFGSAGDDTFTFQNAGSIAGTINGSGGNDTIIGDNDGNTFVITGANAGTLAGKIDSDNDNAAPDFTNIESLTGGTGTDSFAFSDTATLAGTINGTSGANDTIDYSAYTTAVSVNLQTAAATGLNGGAASAFSNIDAFVGGTAATDTITGLNGGQTITITANNAGNFGGTVTFSSFENVTGGTGNDSFVLNDGFGVTAALTGGTGTDTLSYVNYTTSVTLSASGGTATNVGSHAGFETFIGGSAADAFSVTPGSTAFTFTGNNPGVAPGDTLTVDLSSIVGTATRTVSGAGTGAITFTGGESTINYNTIEAATPTGGTWVLAFDLSAYQNGADNALSISRSGANLVFVIEGDTLISEPLAGFTSLTIPGTSDDDHLTVNFAGGNPIPGGGLTLNALETGGDNDSITLNGGAFTTITHVFTNSNDGSIALDASSITYTGLDPIFDNLSATNRVFTFNNNANVITLSDEGVGGNGITRIASDGSETVDFVNPSATLTLNTGTAGGGSDTLTITDPVDLDGVAISVNANESLILTQTGILDSSLSVTVDADNNGTHNLAVNSDITTAAGRDLAFAGTAGAADTITLALNVDLTSGQAITVSSAGLVLTTGGTSILTSGNNADITLPAITGNSAGLTVTSQDDISITSITGAGAIQLTVDSNNDGAGDANITGSVAGSASLTLTGAANDTATFNGVSTSGLQDYTATGGISLVGTYASTNNSIAFNSNVTLTGATIVNAANAAQTITFGGSVAGGATSLTINPGQTATFNGNVTLATLNTTNSGNPYDVLFLGSATSITNAVTFNNTLGTITLGNGALDTLTFDNGFNASALLSASLFGTVAATVNTATITLPAVTVNGNSSIDAAGGTLTTGLITGVGSPQLTLSSFNTGAGDDGTINVTGPVTGLDTLIVALASNVTFSGTVFADNIALQLTDRASLVLPGIITFNGAVGSSVNPVAQLQLLAGFYDATFNAGGFVTTAVTPNNVNGIQIGTVTLGNGAGDIITFVGGFDTVANNVNLRTFGTIRTAAGVVAIGNTTLNGNTTIDTTNNGGNALGANVNAVAGDVTGGGFSLTIIGGTAGDVSLGQGTTNEITGLANLTIDAENINFLGTTVATTLIDADATTAITVTDNSVGNAGTATVRLEAGTTITDASNSATAKIAATGISLVAGTGIGEGGDALEINATNLDFQNATSGVVNVTDLTGGVTITDLTFVTGNHGNLGTGATTVTANSPLTVNVNLIFGGDTTLTAGNNGAAVGDNLTINNTISLTNVGAQSFTGQAGDDIAFGATGLIASTGGGTHTVNLDANRDGAGDGDTGSISQAGAVVTIRSEIINLDAGGGIGSVANPLRLQGANLAAQTISADNTAAGDVVIRNTASGATTVTSLTAASDGASGLAEFIQTGNQTLAFTSVNTGTVTTTNLENTGAALTVTALTNTAAGGTVNIETTTSGLITLGTVTATIDTVVVNSAAGAAQTGALTAANLLVLGTGAFDLTNAGNNVATIAGDVTGSLTYVDSNAVIIGDVATTSFGSSTGLTTSGALSVTATGLTVNATDAGNDVSGVGVTLDARTGTLTVNATNVVNGNAGAMIFTGDEIDLTDANSIRGTSTLLLQPTTAGLLIGINDGTAGARLDLTAAEILALQNGFSGITIGRADGTHAFVIQNITFNDPVTFQAPGGTGGTFSIQGTITGTAGVSVTITGVDDATATSGVTFFFGGGISTQGQNITITEDIVVADGVSATIDTTAGAAITGAAVSITGDLNGQNDAANEEEQLTINGGTAGSINVGGSIGLVADLLYLPTAASVNVLPGNYGDTNPIYTADTLTFPGAGTIDGTGTFTLQPLTSNRAVRIVSDFAANALNITQADIDAFTDGFTRLVIGRSDGDGTMTISEAGNATFLDPVTFRMPAPGGSIRIGDPLLNVTTRRLIAAVDGISLDGGPGILVDGPGSTTTIFGDQITSALAIIFSDAVVLANTVTIDTTNAGGAPAGAEIRFENSLNGTASGVQDLTLIAGTAGDINFQGPVGNTVKVGDVTVTSVDDVVASGDVNVASYNQVAVGENVTFNGNLSATGTAGVVGGVFIGSGTPVTGTVQVFGNIVTTGQVDTNGGAVTIAAANAILISGSTTTTGGPASAGQVGRNGGNVTLDGSSVSVAAVNSSGSDGNANTGGNAGTILINTNFVGATPINLSGNLRAVGGQGTTVGNGANITLGNANNETINIANSALTFSSNGTASGNITFSGDVLGAGNATSSALTLVAGGGNISFEGTAVDPAADDVAGLADLIISSANDVSFSAGETVNVGSIAQTTGTGTTHFRSTVTTTDSGGIVISTAIANFGDGVGTDTVTINAGGPLTINTTGAVTFALNTPVTLNSGGSVTITNGGLLTISEGSPFVLNGGGSFSQSGAGLVSLGSNITTQAGNISFNSAVTLADTTTDLITLSTGVGTGNITFNSSVAGTSGIQDLTLGTGSGNITVSGALGGADGTAEIDDLTITVANNVNFLGTVDVNTFTQTLGLGTTTFGDTLLDVVDIDGDATFTIVNNIVANAAVTVGTVDGDDLTVGAATNVTFNRALTVTDGDATFTLITEDATFAGLVTVGDGSDTDDDLTVGSVRDLTFSGTPAALDVDGDVSVGSARNISIVGTSTALTFLQSAGTGNTTITGLMTLTDTTGTVFSVTTSGLLTIGNGAAVGGGLEVADNTDILMTVGDADFTDAIGDGAANGHTGGIITIQPDTIDGDIGVGVATGDLNLSNADIANLSDGFNDVFIGRADGTGQMEIGSGPVFKDRTSFRMPGTNGVIGIVNLAGLSSNEATAHLIFDTTTVNLGGNVTTAGANVFFISGGSLNTANPAAALGDNVALFDDLLEVTVTAISVIDTTNGGAVATGADITFEDRIDGDGDLDPLTLNAGSAGDLTVGFAVNEGEVGLTNRLGAITVTNANDSTWNGSVQAASFTQSAGTGNTSFLGTTLVVAGNPSALALRTGRFDAVAGGDVSITTTGTVLVDAGIDTSGGPRLVTNPGLNGGAVSINGGDITVGSINTSGSNALNSGAGGNAGDITLNATDGTPTITLAGDLIASRGSGAGGGNFGNAADVTLHDATLLLPGGVSGANQFATANTITVIGNDVTFHSTVDSSGVARSLVVNTLDNANQGTPAGITTFHGNVGQALALDNLITDISPTFASNGQTVINTQFVNAATMIFNDPVIIDAASSTLRGSSAPTQSVSVTFNSTVDSQTAENNSLTINAVTTTFNGNVGSTRPILTLTTDNGSPADVTILNAATFNANIFNFFDPVRVAIGTPGTPGTATVTATDSINFFNTIDSIAGENNNLILDAAVAINLGDGAGDFVGSLQPLNNLTTQGAGVVNMRAGAVGANTVTTVNNQTYNNAVILFADTVLLGNNVFFNNTVNSSGAARDLTVRTTGGVTRFGDNTGDDRVGATLALDVLTVDNFTTAPVPSDITEINADIFAATMVFNDNVTIGPDAPGGDGTIVLAATAALADSTAVTFNGTVNSVSGNNNLTIEATTTTFNGIVGGTQPLGTVITTDGGADTTIINTSAMSAVTFQFDDPVRLDTNTTVTGTTSVLFNDTVVSQAGETNDLTVNSPSTLFAANVGGTVEGGADALGNLTTDAAGTTTFRGLFITATEDITFNDALLLGAPFFSDLTFFGNDVTFNGTLNEEIAISQQRLTINTHDNGGDFGITTFNATVGGLNSGVSFITTDADGATVLNADITTYGGGQDFADPVVLRNDVVLTHTNAFSTIRFQSTVDTESGLAAGLGDLTIAGTSFVTFEGTVGGDADPAGLSTKVGLGSGVGASLTILTTGTTTVNGIVTTATGILQDNAAGLVTFRRNVTVLEGDATPNLFNGNVTFNGFAALTFQSAVDTTFGNANTDQLTLTGNPLIITTVAGVIDTTPDVTFEALVDGAQDLTLNVLGDTLFKAPVGSTTAIGDGTGPAITINSTGTTIFDSTVRTNSGFLQDDAAGTVTFRDNVNVLGGSASTFNGDVELDGMTFTSATNITFGNDIFGPTFDDSLTLIGGPNTITTAAANANILFNALVDGAQDLTVSSGGGTIGFNLPVGSVTPLTNLVTNGTGNTTIAGGSVTTTGDQTYNSPVLISVNTLLTGNDVTFNNTLNSSAAAPNLRSLVITADGDTTFNGVVGGVNPLLSLLTDGGGNTIIRANITTNGDFQDYLDAVQVDSVGTIVLTHTDNGTDRNVGIRFQNTLNSFSAASTDLTLVITGASGDIDFGNDTTDAVGAVNRLGNVNITAARNVLATATGNNAFVADSLTIATPTADVMIEGQVVTTGTVGGNINITANGFVALLGGANTNGTAGNAGNIALRADADATATTQNPDNDGARFTIARNVGDPVLDPIDVVILDGTFNLLSTGGTGGNFTLNITGRGANLLPTIFDDLTPTVATIISRPVFGSDVTINTGTFAMGQNEKGTFFGNLTIDATSGTGDITVGDLNVHDTLTLDVDLTADIIINVRNRGTSTAFNGTTQTDLGVDFLVGDEFIVPKTPIRSVFTDQSQPIIASPGADHDPTGDGGLLSVYINRDYGALDDRFFNFEAAVGALPLGTVVDFTPEPPSNANVSEAIAAAIPTPEQSGDVFRDTGIGVVQQQLVQEMGILPRDLTSVEFVWLLANRRFYNDIGGAVGPDSRLVANDRLLYRPVEDVLMAFRDLFYVQTPEGQLESRREALAGTMQQAYEAFVATGTEFSPAAFRKFLEESPTQAEALATVQGLQELMRRIELLGLTPSEVSAVKIRVYGFVLPRGMNTVQMDQVVNPGSDTVSVNE
jgi:filamentous hemagglutinin family protein